MRRLSLPVLVVLASACLGAAACDSENPNTPTVPTLPVTTETFSGTLTINGAITFPFFSTNPGAANALIRSLTPDLVVTTAPGGTGTFTPGETVFQGPGTTTGDATWTGVVHSFTPATNLLTIRGGAGTFAPDGLIVGVDSRAAWTGKSIAATVVGLALGTWSGTTCSIVLAGDASSLNSQITGVVQGAGALCARVYDVGRLTEPVGFTIEVAHF